LRAGRIRKPSPPPLVAEYNEKVKKKGENKAVKGIEEMEHDRTGRMTVRRKGWESKATRQEPMMYYFRCAFLYHDSEVIFFPSWK
jgi:hypothetical protein